jgi:hypothetical protein
MRNLLNWRAISVSSPVSELLKTLPKKPNALTTRQAIEAIRVDLIKTRERGYSMEDLCAILKEKGFNAFPCRLCAAY